jgi:hypothetical protein
MVELKYSPYTMDEANFMFRNFNPLILDALKDGIIIYDEGFWRKLKKNLKIDKTKNVDF